MKKIALFMVALVAVILTGCMDQHDVPNVEVYGNPNVPEANTTIANLKKQFKSITASSGVQQIEDSIVISGVIVADDESGNVYKQIYLRDTTAAIVIGINTTGIYSKLPVGQRIVVNCKGLYIGGYGAMAQLGTLYQGKIGRMSENVWKEHMRTEGKPSLSYKELVPDTIDASWLSSANKDDAPFFVYIQDATIEEADGNTVYAPEELGDGGNGVNRTLKIGNTTIPFRISTYANFANDYMPNRPFNMCGLLTRYNNDWQITVRTSRDIER